MAGRYWTEIDGRRYVQVYEVDSDHFAKIDTRTLTDPDLPSAK